MDSVLGKCFFFVVVVIILSCPIYYSFLRQTLDRVCYSSAGSYLSNHCRKKPNSGRCRREGLALQAVTNVFNSDTLWGSIVLRYFQFCCSALEGKGKKTQQNNHYFDRRQRSRLSSARAPLLSLMLTCADLTRMPHGVPHFICFAFIRQHVYFEECF